MTHNPADVKVLRGRVLTFVEEPQGLDDTASYRYIEDGAVFIGGDGKIIMVGEFNPKAAAHHTVIDHRPNLILPGFIDPHIHMPQMQVIGSYAGATCSSGSTPIPSSRSRSSAMRRMRRGSPRASSMS